MIDNFKELSKLTKALAKLEPKLQEQLIAASSQRRKTNDTNVYIVSYRQSHKFQPEQLHVEKIVAETEREADELAEKMLGDRSDIFDIVVEDVESWVMGLNEITPDD